MPLRFFSRSNDDKPEDPGSPLVKQLKDAGATVQVFEGMPTSVAITDTADDELLESLSQVDTIEKLSLDWCYSITDEGIRKLASLENLTSLRIAGAEVTGAGFDAFSDHTGLESLDLDGSSITDESLLEIAKIPCLTSLFLRYTGITDSGLANLAGSTRLSILHLDGSAITGASLPELRHHKKLEVLSLPSGIQGSDLQALRGFGSLRWLWLGDASVDAQSVEDLKSTLNPICSVGWRRQHSEQGD